MTPSAKVAANCRVSTSDQHADIQVEAIRWAARQRGWDLVAEHVDAGGAGGRDRRPALDALLEQVERREVDVVIARLDHFGRSLAHVLKLLDRFSKHGAPFVSLVGRLSTGREEGLPERAKRGRGGCPRSYALLAWRHGREPAEVPY